MREYTLANIVYDEDGFLADCPGITLRVGDGYARPDGQGGLVLSGDVDFTTYLNGLSIGKWRQYTHVGTPCLHIEARGAAFQLYPTAVTRGDEEVRRGETPLVDAIATESWTSVDVLVPVPDDAPIVSFALLTDGEVHIRDARWYAHVNDSDVRDVKLVIATTTFRKEEYVTRNIQAIKDQLFCEGSEAADAVRLVVVDNGRTLDAESLSDDKVTVIPNPNVGGSGGFARGMMAALDMEASHVLLMDDDVRVLPESFKRTLALLRLANDAYADAFVEGGMLNMEDPNLLFEDVAVVKRDGMYGRIKEDLLIDTVGGILANETTSVELPRAYGAWWYCCIPTAAVREHGLPLPLFVRCDDVEYGMRCAPTIMTMNGICVWHERFEGRFRASVDSYQLTRNFLIMSASDGLDRGIIRAFLARFSRTFNIYLRAMSYDTCDLMLDGLADYLRGPQFIAEADGEEILKSNGAHNEVLTSIEELDPEIVAATTPDPRYLGQGRDRGMLLKTIEMLPHDRHMLPDFLLSDKPAPAYYARGAYPARRTMRRKTLVAYDQSATHAHVRHMDRGRWQQLRRRYRVLMHDLRVNGASIAEQYREALPSLTSREFWEDYLAKRG